MKMVIHQRKALFVSLLFITLFLINFSNEAMGMRIPKPRKCKKDEDCKGYCIDPVMVPVCAPVGYCACPGVKEQTQHSSPSRIFSGISLSEVALGDTFLPCKTNADCAGILCDPQGVPAHCASNHSCSCKASAKKNSPGVMLARESKAPKFHPDHSNKFRETDEDCVGKCGKVH